MANVTRLCTTKALLTVNGQYPGPTIVAREGDRMVVNVTNNVQNNVSIHWYLFCSLIHLIKVMLYADVLLSYKQVHLVKCLGMEFYSLDQGGWADGPAYVTQCPIQTGQSYVYKFMIKRQRATLWWHAHISWLPASLQGSIIIYPKKNASYPFPRPH